MEQQGGWLRQLRRCRRGARCRAATPGAGRGQFATVRNQVLLSMFTDFENYSVFKPDARHEKSVNEMFDQVIAWGGALKALRDKGAWDAAKERCDLVPFTCTSLALLRKSLIINGAGEGNRTLVPIHPA